MGWPNRELPDRDQSGPWRVGVLFSQTGVTAAAEQTLLNGALLAIDQVNAAGGVLGREIVPVVYDPASSPKLSKRYAEQLLDVDRVSIIFGCYMSSTRKAALPVVEARGGMLFYPTLYEGFEYSVNCVYTGSAPNQNSVPLARYLLKNFGTRFALIGSNYVYPYDSNRIMADLVVQSKGRILEEIYLPLDAGDELFAGALEQIAGKEPDVIFSTVVGQGTARLYEAFRRRGLDPYRTPIASLTTSEAEIAEMSPEVAEGHITAAPYFSILDTPKNREFVAAFRVRFGADAPITAGAEAAYFQVFAFARALERAGSCDAGLLLAQLRGMEIVAPQGTVAIDGDNNHSHLWPRVAKVSAKGSFEIVWQSAARVAPDPYFITPNIQDWSVAPAGSGEI